MSVLATLPDIKVPYASEGVIRTAQLDDTVAPENSVQLAVNMNFDRVGAIQTRPGVTQYADDLTDAINNYGTLRNSIVPPGYVNIAQLGTTEDLARTMKYVSAVKVSDTKVVIFYTDASNHGWTQNLKIDERTGIITPIGTPLEFETTFNSNNVAILLGNGFVMNVWTGNTNDGIAEAFDVSGDSVVAKGVLDFDTGLAQNFSLANIDNDHVILFYASGLSIHGTAVALRVDPSTGVTTQPGSALTFDATPGGDHSAVAVGDGIHFIDFWYNTVGNAQAFAVNTSTWAITALSSPLNFASSFGQMNNALSCFDGSHFVNIYRGTSDKATAQAFVLNLSTFALTTIGTPVFVSTTSGNDLFAVGFPNGTDFVAFFSSALGSGFVQMVHMDPSTFNMSLRGALLDGYDFANQHYLGAVDLTADKVMIVWGNVNAVNGQAAMFQSFGNVVNGRWLYAASGDEIFNTAPGDAGVWVSRRSGLAQVSKPRFSQYLNYIWMVNGNEQLGGDPVATSAGGNFGTDLVPDDFPKGDFISAGFEGRVWVVNKTLGIIYYTDIVQFIPPATYTLTYNPQVNFISSLSPQTGQEFTALIQVPRALLIFTEDTIRRIYGASSVDAYAAYNVGTYSQESIIQTKTGIFFHHSSGFYQFDYGSQPVEISRRIIDFVKAIPRSEYANIVGVWDEFDCVKWYIGEVLVEGVVFRNCMVRYTISTQVWTVYDYKGIDITALVGYDDGIALTQVVGGVVTNNPEDPSPLNKTGTLDTGNEDYEQPFYYEFIDRWRPYTNMYYLTKSISGVNVYSENAAGANLLYQMQKSGPNAWKPIGTVTEANNAIMPNSDTEDFDVIRWRLTGNTKGAQVVVHGIEITSLTIKGQEQN